MTSTPPSTTARRFGASAAIAGALALAAVAAAPSAQAAHEPDFKNIPLCSKTADNEPIKPADCLMQVGYDYWAENDCPAGMNACLAPGKSGVIDKYDEYNSADLTCPRYYPYLRNSDEFKQKQGSLAGSWDDEFNNRADSIFIKEKHQETPFQRTNRYRYEVHTPAGQPQTITWYVSGPYSWTRKFERYRALNIYTLQFVCHSNGEQSQRGA